MHGNWQPYNIYSFSIYVNKKNDIEDKHIVLQSETDTVQQEVRCRSYKLYTRWKHCYLWFQ